MWDQVSLLNDESEIIDNKFSVNFIFSIEKSGAVS